MKKASLTICLLVIAIFAYFNTRKPHHNRNTLIVKKETSPQFKQLDRKKSFPIEKIDVESHARQYLNQYDESAQEQKLIPIKGSDKWERIKVLADKNGVINSYQKEVYSTDQKGREQKHSQEKAFMGQSLVVLNDSSNHSVFIDQLKEQGWTFKTIGSDNDIFLVKFPFDDLETHLTNEKLLHELLGGKGIAEPNHIITSF